MVNKLKTMDTVFCLNMIVLKMTKNKKNIETKRNTSPKILGCGVL